MSSAFRKFDSFVAACAHGVHHLNIDSLKVMLSDVSPVRSDSFAADIIEISSGNGYVVGGLPVVVLSSSQTLGLYKLVLDTPVDLVASGGSIAQFRYTILYNDDAANDELIGWWDEGTEVILVDTDIFRIRFGAVSGVLTLQ
jgi:hypothetical protein